eukprot:2806837-Rhodomonas_salina.1
MAEAAEPLLQRAPSFKRAPSLRRVASLKKQGSFAKSPVSMEVDTPLHPTHRARNRGHRQSIEINLVEHEADLDLSQSSFSSEEAATIFPPALRSQLQPSSRVQLSPSRFGNRSMEEEERPLTFRELARTGVSGISTSMDASRNKSHNIR